MAIVSLPRLVSHKLGRLQSEYPGRLRLGFIGLLAAIVLITSIQYLAKVSRPGESGQQMRSAFLRWRTMVREVFDGVNVYTGLNEYPNPPVMAIILRPFAELPPVPGAMAWFYAKVAMAVLAVLWMFRLTSQPGAGLPDAAKAAAIVVALPALIGDLTHNNVNIFILFLLAACLELYRRRRDGAAGLVLGLAIACKVTPLLFLAYFGWKRAWTVVAGCLAGLVLWLAIVPSAVFGWRQNEQLLTDWYKLMVERPILKGEVATEHANQAMPGFVYRLFSHSPSSIEYVELGPDVRIPTPAAYHNVCDIGRPGAWWVVKSFTACFALAVVLLCRVSLAERQGWRLAAECGLIVLGMLLLSERTWKHHAVTLVLPAAVVASVACALRPGRLRSAAIASLTTAWLLMTVPGVFGAHAGELALIYGACTIAFLLLAVSLCVLLYAGRSGAALSWRPGSPMYDCHSTAVNAETTG
jgi:hypothetical protein